MNTELVKISFKIKVLFGLPVPGGSGGLRTSIREYPVVWGHPSGAEGRCREERLKSEAVVGCPSPPFPTPDLLGWERSQGRRHENGQGGRQSDLFIILDLIGNKPVFHSQVSFAHDSAW